MLQSTTSSNSRHASSGPSPSASIPKQEGREKTSDVSIESLIAYLLAAKKSLSSIHHVHRATTILTEARSIVEATAILVAKTKYLRRSLNSQLRVLRSIQYELEATAHGVKQEIHTTVKDLEKVDRRLHGNIDLLKETAIEDGFKPRKARDENDEEIEVDLKHTLHDFVDDHPVEAVRQTAQAAQGSVDAARVSIDDSIRELEDDLQRVNEVLADKTATSSSTKSDLHPLSIPKQLRQLERNAHDMAQSLESLVKHFDSCVNAIKHTEGAGAAMVKNFSTDDLPEGVDVEAFQGPAESMSEDDRIEMVTVLRTDAEQVEEVVADIQDRASEMEALLERIMLWRDSREAAYQDISLAFQLLEKIGDQLPVQSGELNNFSVHWTSEKGRIEDCIAGMEELCEMYENFLTAYDGMIVEAVRRKGVRRKMEKIVQDAQKQLDQLYQDDLAEREHFRTERGDFLPSDIWHGLDVLPAQFGFQRLNEEGLGSIPDLPKEVVTEAWKRLKAAQGIDD